MGGLAPPGARTRSAENHMVRNVLTISHEGRRCVGAWTVKGRLVTVTLPCYERKSTQLGHSPPAILARIMLRELAKNDLPAPCSWPRAFTQRAFRARCRTPCLRPRDHRCDLEPTTFATRSPTSCSTLPTASQRVIV